MNEYPVLVIPDFQSVVITAITLAILYFVFKRFLYEPVSTFLQDRRNRILGEIEDADYLKAEAEEMKANQEAMISKAQIEGQKIVENARKYGEEVKENIILEAQQQAREIILKAEKETERQKQLMLQDVKSQSIDMGILIASKIMEEQINVDKQNLLIDKFIDEVGSSEWKN